MHKSLSLKYAPSSEPLHNSEKQVFLNREPLPGDRDPRGGTARVALAGQVPYQGAKTRPGVQRRSWNLGRRPPQEQTRTQGSSTVARKCRTLTPGPFTGDRNPRGGTARVALAGQAARGEAPLHEAHPSSPGPRHPGSTWCFHIYEYMYMYRYL